MTARPLLPPTPVLETERLILRPIRAEDAPAIQRRFPQWDVVKHLTGKIPWPYPADGAAVNMVATLKQMQRRKKLTWAITLKSQGDELIGRIDLLPDSGIGRGQRGFWLDPAYWGRGLMTEAADRVTEYAFMELGWPHLWLRNGVENLASHRVKEKQGARIVGRVRSHLVSGKTTMSVVWLLTREDWLKHREERS